MPKAASNTCITPNGGRSKNNTIMPTCWQLACPCHGSVRHLSSIKKVQQDLKAPGLCKQKVLAMMVYLLEHTLIRIGNDAYARSNASFGLSTLRHRHVQIHQHDLQFGFRGKSGIVHRIRLHDARLARWLSRLRALPGQRLFQYVDRQGQRHAIGSAEVNAYLSQASQQQVTAKDFRTWFGSLYALQLLQSFAPVEHAQQAKRNVAEAIRKTAARLGNTAAVCRRSYVHPALIKHYLDGTLAASDQGAPGASAGRGQTLPDRPPKPGRRQPRWHEGNTAQRPQTGLSGSSPTGLGSAERTLLKILKNN
jgi:DNA topoisomerase IB